jgi:DtxR family Mn-dependent transcriptional regulator
MIEKLSATIEDYLASIYILERDNEPVQGVRLAELLDVSPPTVTNTLKRMVRDGLIAVDEKKSVHLTDDGLEKAKTVMRRHMLAEWMLSRLVSWSKVHKEAHLLEHAITEEVENALDENLNQPELCPHGNPFPGHEELVKDWMPLNEMKTGDRVIIRRVHELAEEVPDVLKFLEEKQIKPGLTARVEDIFPYNQTITLQVGENQIVIGFSLARYLFVERQFA